MDNAQIASRIKELCKERHIPISGMLTECAIRKSLIYDMEKRDYTPSIEIINKISKFFEVSTDYLLGNVSDPFFTLNNEQILNDINSYTSDDFTPVDVAMYEVIGTVSAGYDGTAVEEHTGEILPVPLSYIKGHPKEDYFVLRIKGDSMYPKLLNGDLVLVQRVTSVDSGNIAVVLYSGEEATVKTVNYIYGENWLELIPTNPEYKTKRIENEDLEQCRVLGKVVKLIRDI